MLLVFISFTFRFFLPEQGSKPLTHLFSIIFRHLQHSIVPVPYYYLPTDQMAAVRRHKNLSIASVSLECKGSTALIRMLGLGWLGRVSRFPCYFKALFKKFLEI